MVGQPPCDLDDLLRVFAEDLIKTRFWKMGIGVLSPITLPEPSQMIVHLTHLTFGGIFSGFDAANGCHKRHEEHHVKNTEEA